MNDRMMPLDVVRGGVARRVFPGACVETGGADGVRWREAVGFLSYEPDALPVAEDTVYDLASLTKPLATTTIAMSLVERGVLDLDTPVAAYEPAWRGADRASVAVRDLLEHASGLPAWAPLWRHHQGRDAIVQAACRVSLEYAPRSKSAYSDLGFIVLGSVLERAGRASLDEQFDRLRRLWSPDADERTMLRFAPPPAARPRAAPTRFSDARERLLVGEVDDENAWAMGGVAGHAGLFGSAAAVGLFARVIMRALGGNADAASRFVGRTTVQRFLTASAVPGSSRALGWDLMRTTSSCGTRMSPSAFGHTGFTGTSLWIDPLRDVYAVLLANRVNPVDGPNEPMQAVRRAFHDALLESGAGP